MTTLEKLEGMFKEGKITRREFLAKASALGVAAAIFPVILGSKAQAATPKNGGRLRIGMQGGSTSDTMDPAKFNDIYQQMTSMGFLRNPLVEIDNQGNAVPDLAESFEAMPDAKSWVFNLRKEAEFHNGKTVDADDVIFSIKRHQDEKLASQIRTLVKPIKAFKKDGPNRGTENRSGRCDQPAGPQNRPLVGQSTETATGQRAGWPLVYLPDALRYTTL